MKVDLFDFDLPRECIAEHPAEPRDSARLLAVGRQLADHVVRDLPGLLRAGDLMVFNDTRVIPARLRGRRGEAGIEVTLHERVADDAWRAFAKGAKKLKVGDLIRFAEGFEAEVTDKAEAGDVGLRFNKAGPDLMAALQAHGIMPLPPYIKRPAEGEARDRDDYQTMFARHEGAVAAPTAGLHFTPSLVEALAAAGIERTTVTLHVGAGTFLPVKVDDTADHLMHSERGVLSEESAEAINRAKASGRRIVAVGTTSLRLLESAAESGRVKPGELATRLFITPGYKFQVVDRLMTNFHLPRSTLFMLVSAFAGLERMQAAYAHAIASGYRFYSYGDACLLDPED